MEKQKQKRHEAKRIAAADCETNPFEYGAIIKPFIWGFYDGESYWDFDNTPDFINFISRQNCVIYFHNGGKFDFHFIFKYLSPYSNLKIINGRIAEIKIGSAILRDSYLIIPQGLGKFIKETIDYSIMKPENRNKNMPEIKAYLKSDCRNLFDIVSRSISLYGNRLTIAGQAVKFWSKLSGVKTEDYRTDSDYYDDTFRTYYFGGRVQVFRFGFTSGNIQCFDINSAYPFAMLHNMPWGFQYTDSVNQKILNTSFITLKAVSTGAFPLRTITGTSFPADKVIREFNITGWEYHTARRLGLLKKPELLKVLNHSALRNYADYIQHFYTIKKQAEIDNDKTLRNFCKLMTNSLYGKFGTNGRDFCDYMYAPSGATEDLKIRAGENDIPLNMLCEIDKDNALYSYPSQFQTYRFYNVAIAASITGFVRAYLLEHIQSAINPIYCDTDSIICEKFSGTIGAELGQWKNEGNFSWIAIGGKKLYVMKRRDTSDSLYKTACKGARLTPLEIFRIAARGKTIEYKQESPTFGINAIGSAKYILRKIRATA